ncbi:MAG TPA: hypothetical protein VN650_01505 [Gemmatimonadaceae bacterium]|nr:hypothetical protein [Gemmatimonadaceae bacterium]
MALNPRLASIAKSVRKAMAATAQGSVLARVAPPPAAAGAAAGPATAPQW